MLMFKLSLGGLTRCYIFVLFQLWIVKIPVSLLKAQDGSLILTLDLLRSTAATRASLSPEMRQDYVNAVEVGQAPYQLA